MCPQGRAFLMVKVSEVAVSQRHTNLLVRVDQHSCCEDDGLPIYGELDRGGHLRVMMLTSILIE